MRAGRPRLTGAAPARSSLRYEARIFETKRNEDHMGPYFGKPNAELDLAWHKLLQRLLLTQPCAHSFFLLLADKGTRSKHPHLPRRAQGFRGTRRRGCGVSRWVGLHGAVAGLS